MQKLLKYDMGYEVHSFKDCMVTRKDLADRVLGVLDKFQFEILSGQGYNPCVTLIIWCGHGMSLPNGDSSALVP